MGFKNKIALALLCAFAFVQTALSQQSDSLIRLVSASSVQIITNDREESFRKAVDAVFLHNGTDMLCDTAFWKVDDNVINAIGHVVLEQNATRLTSDKMDYFVDENLAKFRGEVVELSDSSGNVLRTRHLDYNTSDSVAVFYEGAALKDKDGQVIESLDGTYDSKTRVFTFSNKVNMYTDTVFLKTSSLEYHSATDRMLFTSYVDFWRKGNMLSSAGGWYDHGREVFFFTGNVHATSEKQETWSDSLYFHRLQNNVEMLGNAQLQDSSRRVSAFAQYIFYEDSLSRVTMMREAAVSIETGEGRQAQTVWFGADTVVYNTVKMCDVPKWQLDAAKGRAEEFTVDPVTQYREKASKEALEAARKAAEADPEAKARMEAGEMLASRRTKDFPAVPVTDKLPSDGAPSPSSSSSSSDTTSVPAAKDTSAVATVPDTSKVGFASGYGNVRVYRDDIQVRSGQMHYSDLDSVARFYQSPIIWNEGNRQYTSDSLFCLVREGRVTQASLLSNAFITTEESAGLYDQIKGAEVMAYFDSSTVLRRFDALGGASAIFYLMENNVFSTVNKVESKMLSANFKDGQLEKVFYYEAPKNDAYPVVQFPKSDRYMKGFDWRPELRPEGKHSVTGIETKASERSDYAKHPRARFPQTDIYFPGYMTGVYADLAKPKPKPAPKASDTIPEPQAVQEDTAVLARHILEAGTVDVVLPDTPADSVTALPDTVGVPNDTPAALRDTSVAAVAADSLVQVRDTVSAPSGTTAAEASVFGRWQKKAAERQAAQQARFKAREEAREARWKMLDERDAERDEARKAKALERKRARTLKDLIAKQKQDIKDRRKLDSYVKYYQKQKDRKCKRSGSGSSDMSESTRNHVRTLNPSQVRRNNSSFSDFSGTNSSPSE